MRLAGWFLFAAGLAGAQDRPEIRGTVLEPGVKGAPALGVAGAEVSLIDLSASPPAVYAAAYTDTTGSFVFRPDRFSEYYLEVKKAGYFGFGSAAPGGDRPGIVELSASVTPEQPLVERQFQLTRPGELSGRVIDEDSNPVAGMKLGVVRASGGILATNVTTNAEGYFSTPDLLPDDYLVRVAPKAGLREKILTDFTGEDAEGMDRDWELSYWPGGGRAETAAPLPVRPGASANLGTIRVRRADYPRVRIFVSGNACGPGQIRNYTVAPESRGPFSLPDVHVESAACADRFLVGNLPDGRYWLGIWDAGDDGAWAQSLLHIGNDNFDVRMTMMPPGDVPVRITAGEEGDQPALDSVAILLGSADGLPAGGTRGAGKTGPDGTAMIENVRWARQRVIVQGVGAFAGNSPARNPNYYVREIRYDGRPVAGGTVTLSGGAVLELVFDGGGAVISGTVRDENGPARGVMVVATPWPLAGLMPGTNQRIAVTKADGTFQFTGLAPGEYRVVAGRGLEQSLTGGDRVTLERGEWRNMTLAPVGRP